MTDHEAKIVFHPDFLRYDFGPQHPLRPERLTLGLDLLESMEIWSPAAETLSPIAAEDTEIQMVHATDYVQAVKRASQDMLGSDELSRYGLSHGDTPAFSGMHDVSALVAGGTLRAVRNIMDGSLLHAFNPGGGWHHALSGRASGFCVYNDPAIAASAAVAEFGARVLYVDFDCHHGDGVQWIFYDDPSVLTVSFHESGRFLFPGTGDMEERGKGPGRGYSVNVPFAPYSQDASWMNAVDTILPAVTEWFHPDVLITAHGADTHIWDPIAHLCLTTDSFVHQSQLAHKLAHTYTRGRWLAVGSGGYDWRRVVPRSWAILWAEMSGRHLAEEIPEAWLGRFGGGPGEALPVLIADPSPLKVPLARSNETDAVNAATVVRVVESNDWATP